MGLNCTCPGAIYMINVAGLWLANARPPPPASKFFQFQAVFWRIWQNCVFMQPQTPSPESTTGLLYIIIVSYRQTRHWFWTKIITSGLTLGSTLEPVWPNQRPVVQQVELWAFGWIWFTALWMEVESYQQGLLYLLEQSSFATVMT